MDIINTRSRYTDLVETHHMLHQKNIKYIKNIVEMQKKIINHVLIIKIMDFIVL